ncbi:hypothetical protein FRC08_009686, partial [Ceratobasidium sp. 394]
MCRGTCLRGDVISATCPGSSRVSPGKSRRACSRHNTKSTSQVPFHVALRAPTSVHARREWYAQVSIGVGAQPPGATDATRHQYIISARWTLRPHPLFVFFPVLQPTLNMIFDLFSLLSLLVLILPLTVLGAPADPISELEARGDADKGRIYKVTVGANDTYRYYPQYVYANPGDYVRFEFYPGDHTVTESSFNYPCKRLDHLYDTGYVSVPGNSTRPYRTYRVKDKKPHWFFCRQDRHCRKGMVFAVNPPRTGNTFR